jgi:hypothetical protein
MINITNIIYDENLKEVLRIARNRLNPQDLQVDPYIKKINKEYFYFTTNKVNKAQKTLREIFNQYKSTLNFILTDNTDKKNYSKPNYYAFCVAFIHDFENNNSWDEIFKDEVNLDIEEFGRTEKNKLDKTQEFITETNRFPITSVLDCKCCCSHSINNIYFMVSKSTGYSMMTGNCCIKKCYIKNPTIMKKLNIIETKRKEGEKRKEKEKKDKEEKEKKKEKNKLNALNSKVNFNKYNGSGLSYLDVSKNDTQYLKWLVEWNYLKINEKYPQNEYIIEWIKSLNI